MDRPRESTAESSALVRLEEVSLSFGSVSVLEDLSLSVPADAVTAVIGPNGSGKTTLLEIVAGVLAADAGDRAVRAEGERPIGYLPQDPRFRPQFSVEETLRYYAGLLEADVDVEASMRQVGLTAVRDRSVGGLSGGMRRLLGIAQSLLGDPQVVVLDEPTSGLDPRMRADVFETVTGLPDAETGVIISSHDLAAVERTDNVVLIAGGSVRLSGSPADLVAEGGASSLDEAYLEAVPRSAMIRAGTDAGGESS
ncbi:MAG: ABC transporter ATP-binding protein [Halobellus sp.]